IPVQECEAEHQFIQTVKNVISHDRSHQPLHEGTLTGCEWTIDIALARICLLSLPCYPSPCFQPSQRRIDRAGTVAEVPHGSHRKYFAKVIPRLRSEEHTSELQSH